MMGLARTACAAALWLGMVQVNALAQTCEISVPATIVDATTGNFLSAIQPAMVHARIKKSYFPVTSLERIQTFRVLLLMDASSSMSAIDAGSLSNRRDTVQKIKEMLDENLNSFPAGVQISFGVFNNEIAFANEFTSDPDRLHHLIPETIARLRSPGTGETVLFDALHMALAQFRSVQPGDTIVLITDGGDNASRQVSKGELARELSQKGIRLFVLVVQRQLSPSNPRVLQSADIMSDFVERSGGAMRTYAADSLRWNDTRRLQSAKEELTRFWLQEVLSAYLLHLRIPTDLHKEQKWLLAIDPAANGKKKIAAGYPSRLEPCSVATAAR